MARQGILRGEAQAPAPPEAGDDRPRTAGPRAVPWNFAFARQWDFKQSIGSFQTEFSVGWTF